MENTSKKFAISRNIGIVTGPLMVIAGLVGYFTMSVNKSIALLVVTMGVVRIALTAYTIWLSKKENQQPKID